MTKNTLRYLRETGIFLGSALSFLFITAQTQAGEAALVPPEVVQAEIVHMNGDTNTVTVSNTTHHYILSCNIQAAGCLSPKSDKNYLLFDKSTRWKMPGASDIISLGFIQDWTVTYHNGENIGLIPEQGGGPNEIGIYTLEKEDYTNQYTVTTDGPIVYGTGLAEEDRERAWKYFFMLMVQACGRQQGNDMLGLKLSRRCQPGQNFCSVMIDANLTGIGGINEPRKVVVIVTSDVNDEKNQLARIVCTWPAKDVRVCRHWSTGKIVSNE